MQLCPISRDLVITIWKKANYKKERSSTAGCILFLQSVCSLLLALRIWQFTPSMSFLVGPVIFVGVLLLLTTTLWLLTSIMADEINFIPRKELAYWIDRLGTVVCHSC